MFGVFMVLMFEGLGGEAWWSGGQSADGPGDRRAGDLRVRGANGLGSKGRRSGVWRFRGSEVRGS